MDKRRLGLAKRAGLAERRRDRPQRREGLGRWRRPRARGQRGRPRRTAQRHARAPCRRNRTTAGRRPVRQRCDCSRCPTRRLRGYPGGWTSGSWDRGSGRRRRCRGTWGRGHSGCGGGRRHSGDGCSRARRPLRCPNPPRRSPGSAALRRRLSSHRRRRGWDGVGHPAAVAHPLARSPGGKPQGGGIGDDGARRGCRLVRQARTGRGEVGRWRGRHPRVQRTRWGQSRRPVVGQDVAHLGPGGRIQRGAGRVPRHLRDGRCVVGSRGGGVRVRAGLSGARGGGVTGRCGGVRDGVAGPRVDQGDLAVGADGAPVVPLPAAGADKLVWHVERMMLPNPPTVPLRHSGVTPRRGGSRRAGGSAAGHVG